MNHHCEFQSKIERLPRARAGFSVRLGSLFAALLLTTFGPVRAQILAAENPAAAATVSVTDLRCEYLSEPLGIDTPLPRFSWKLLDAAKTRGQCKLRPGNGITPESERPAVFANFKAELDRKGYLDTGSSGLPILLKFMVFSVSSGAYRFYSSSLPTRAKQDERKSASPVAKFLKCHRHEHKQ